MATKNLTQAAPAASATPVAVLPAINLDQELVVIAPRGGYPEYLGSRAQLEAEGLIPKGTVWPEGRQWLEWKSGLLHFSLFRTRKQGSKGPAKVWMEGDWWCLRCELANARDHMAQRIREMQAEIAVLTHIRSPQGRREFYELSDCMVKSRNDSAFQAFKSTFIPEPKKLGRRAGKAQR